MQKIKGLLLAATLMLTAGRVLAQSYSDLGLTFGRTKPGGSARIMGMGGAQISLGGDWSSAASNPAGLGMYNRSEFSVTPGYMSIENNGTYLAGTSTLSTNNTQSRTALNIPGISLVFSKPQDGEAGFIHGTFAVTMTKLNDFNSNIQYKGTNSTTSLIDYFIDQAYKTTPDNYVEDQNGNIGALYNTVTGLAYRNYLIGEASFLDPANPNDEYFTDFDRGVNPNVLQHESIQTKGAQNQWNLAYGANFNDKFFLGGSLGIVSLNFQSHKVFDEDFVDQPIIGYTLVEDLSVRGTGINLTVGGIYRPVEGLQIGAAIATPTRYSITDTYAASMNSTWDNFDYGDGSPPLNDVSAETDQIVSNYTLTTPWKFSAGASYIFGKSGLISVDVEQINYGGSKYQSKTNDIDFTYDNKQMKSQYASATNIRAGGEYRIKKFRIRGGFGYMQDPYRTSQPSDVNNARLSASGGLGFRANKWYVDLAYINSWSNTTYRPYTFQDPRLAEMAPQLNYKQSVTNVMLTVGFTF